ncbi:MAG: DUF1109 family protein [Bdellovibrionales bacterium]|nr:DUF1109 family protein [Bdellovibrionales bacterium]
MKPTDTSTSSLIDRLVAERPERRPFRLTLARGLGVAAFAGAAAIAIARATKFRAPLADLVSGPHEAIELGLLLIFLVLAVVFAIGTAIPGWTERRPRLTRVTLAAFGLAAATILVRASEGATHSPFFGSWGISCALLLAAVGLGSALLLSFIVRRGTVTRPALTAWGTTFFGCAMGMLVLELHCGDESASHLLVGHFGGLLTFALFFAPFAYRRLAKRK